MTRCKLAVNVNSLQITSHIAARVVLLSECIKFVSVVRVPFMLCRKVMLRLLHAIHSHVRSLACIADSVPDLSSLYS